MTTSGSWRIYGSVDGLPSGIRSVDVEITAPTTGIDNAAKQTINGFSAVSVPSGASAVLIIPPTANTNTITLKGITGDTGVALSKVYPTAIAFDTSPPSTIGITTGASTAIQFVWM